MRTNQAEFPRDHQQYFTDICERGDYLRGWSK